MVADVDNDGQVEIALGHCDWKQALTVYGNADVALDWPPGPMVWNQHAFYISNVDDLGTIPAPTGANYAQYDSFRSGNTGLPPGECWDLYVEVLEVCEADCALGMLHIAVRPINAGNAEAPAGISISLRAGEGGAILAKAETAEAIPGGHTGELVLFDVLAAAFLDVQPVVTVDENASGLGKIFECDEVNNVEVWPERVCEGLAGDRAFHSSDQGRCGCGARPVRSGAVGWLALLAMALIRRRSHAGR